MKRTQEQKQAAMRARATKTKQAPRMTTAEILAEEMFFQNICDTVENETETGTTFATSRREIN